MRGFRLRYSCARPRGERKGDIVRTRTCVFWIRGIRVRREGLGRVLGARPRGECESGIGVVAFYLQVAVWRRK